MSNYLDLIPSKFMEQKSDTLVPPIGKADTVAGEIVRAFDRITYRYYNDGDVLDEGDGISTVNSSFRYLCSTVPDVADLRDNFKFSSEDDYEEFLYDLQTAVQSYLQENPELEETPNKDDSRVMSSEERDAYEQYQRELEYYDKY